MSAGDRIGGPQPIDDSTFVPVRSADGRSRAQRALLFALSVFAAVLVAAISTVFMFGDELFGSDPDTIDTYNVEVLESCELPADSTLVRTVVLRVFDREGRSYRGMAHLYASPLHADHVVDFYGLDAPGLEARVGENRSCKFGQRPSARVMLASSAVGAADVHPTAVTEGVSADPLDDFWAGAGAEIVDITEPPAALSFFRLWLAQRETEGVF